MNPFSPPLWRLIQRQSFTNWEKLANFLELNTDQRKVVGVKSRFPLLLPFRLAEKIKKGSLEDPILKQFLPTLHEQEININFVKDPVKDETFRKEGKLLHKYEGRALLICSGACAMHCRYCFRQNFDYGSEDKTFREELDYIAKDSSIQEIILSGGDPLSLNDQTLGTLMEEMDQIPHLQRIRFHTRFPIGIPERIDDSFLTLLKKSTKQIWFVIHSNHPNEWDEEIAKALRKIQRLGIPLLNQSVLLQGVNDDVATLKHLSEILANYGIFPYYIHQLDRVEGAAHFEVDKNKGKKLIEELGRLLPGYAVPRYVQEIPGEGSKTGL